MTKSRDDTNAKQGYRFKKLPAYGVLNINHTSNTITPNDIYAYAVAFRDVYEKSKPLSKNGRIYATARLAQNRAEIGRLCR